MVINSTTSTDISAIGGAAKGVVGAFVAVQPARQQPASDCPPVANNESPFNQAPDHLRGAKEDPETPVSRIQDLATANASTDFARNSILSRSGVALRAQGSHDAQSVFQLLQ